MFLISISFTLFPWKPSMAQRKTKHFVQMCTSCSQKINILTLRGKRNEFSISDRELKNCVGRHSYYSPADQPLCSPQKSCAAALLFFMRDWLFPSWLYPGGPSPGVLPATVKFGRAKASSSSGAGRRQKLPVAKKYEEQWNIQGKIHPG